MDTAMQFDLECEREDDGRWLAEVPQLPGVLAYGDSANDAMAKAQILALRVLAERLENNETAPQAITFSIAACRPGPRRRRVASTRRCSVSRGSSSVSPDPIARLPV